MTAIVLFDAPGPIARRRTLIGSAIALLAIAGVLVWVVLDLVAQGQFGSDKWGPLVHQERMVPFLASGLRNTLTAAAVALVFAFVLGIVLAVGRLSPYLWLRLGCTLFVEFFRGAPVLLLMLFYFLAFPILFGLDLPTFWTVVLALTLFNGAVICEIVRAGVASLPRGQTEAADAIGLRRMHVLRLVLLPQALRVMLPTLVSQFVVLLKDTSLGFIVGYQELMQRSQAVGLMFNNMLQILVITAVIYVILNSAVAKASHSLSGSQTRISRRTVSAPRVDDHDFAGGSSQSTLPPH